MSETKTNEPVKQEGDFSLKGKSKRPKQLSNKAPEVVKVNIKEPLVDLEPELVAEAVAGSGVVSFLTKPSKSLILIVYPANYLKVLKNLGGLCL